MSITLENVSYDYPQGKKKALDNVSLTFRDGEITAVIGRSGSGKSTLLRLLNGLRKPTEGKIEGNTFDTALVFQYPETQLFEETVIKDVEFGPKNKGRSEKESREDAEEALRMVGIGEDKWNVSPLALSGGEKRRVALAGILAMKCSTLVLDEISSGLDGEGKRIVFDIIRKLSAEGKTVIFTTHDSEEAARFSDRVILLENGRVRSDGTIEDASECDSYFLTQGMKLKRMLENEGIRAEGKMTSLTDSIQSLSSLLGME